MLDVDVAGAPDHVSRARVWGYRALLTGSEDSQILVRASETGPVVGDPDRGLNGQRFVPQCPQTFECQ
jgi:hypothetical protein